MFKEEESTEILDILSLIKIIYNYFKNMTEEKVSQKFRLKNTDQAKKYFIKEIKQNELISKIPKKGRKILKYSAYLLI